MHDIVVVRMCKERRETEVGKYGQFGVMRAIRSKYKADD